ncbi:MAG: STAS-like domain-containing protein [bacterium]
MIGDRECFLWEDGEKIQHLIRAAIARGDEVEVSFAGTGFVIGGFLMAAIGELYRDVPEEILATHLRCVDMDEGDRLMLEMQLDTVRFHRDNPGVVEVPWEDEWGPWDPDE